MDRSQLLQIVKTYTKFISYCEPEKFRVLLRENRQSADVLQKTLLQKEQISSEILKGI